MTFKTVISILSLTASAVGAAPSPARLDLSGDWAFALDPDDKGIEARWFAGGLKDRIRLPGTTDLAGKGFALDPATLAYPLPFTYSLFPGLEAVEQADRRGFLVRERVYIGRAWYQRDVDIPADWKDRPVRLSLERVIWESRVWVDERPAGSCDSLAAPHEYDLGILSPGRHRLTIAVDNRMIHNTGTIGHSYGPETQSRWNGVVGRIELTAADAVSLRRIRTFPDADRNGLRVRIVLRNTMNAAQSGELDFTVLPEAGGDPIGAGRASATAAPGDTPVEAAVKLDRTAEPWDEFNPTRYRLVTRWRAATGTNACETLFGFRHIARDGRHIRVNGRRVFLRGTLDCCVYPKTGHPPVTVEEWTRVLSIIKDHGFNHVRYHSWCPPEAAFEAADRLGLYLAPETMFWVDGWTLNTLGKPKALGKDPDVLAFVRNEIRRIGESYGNHPSFAFFCIGNEFASKETDWDTVNGLIEEAKQRDPRRLYNASTARKRVPADDYWVTHNSGASTRGTGPAHTDWDFGRAADAADLPVVAHETGQHPVFPDYDDLLPKFTGPLNPRNYKWLRRELEAAGLGGQVKEFERASARFQYLMYKAEHEGMLRTADYGGYQLLMLNDFTGQSEALVGLLDPFWESKGIVTREEILRWNAPVVVLARFPSYTWTAGETFTAELEVANYGPTAMGKASADWKLETISGEVLAAGHTEPRAAPAGALTRLGRMTVPLPSSDEAAALRLVVHVGAAENAWNLWCYPSAAPVEEPDGVLVTQQLDDEALAALEAGGRVILLAHGFKRDWAMTTGFAPVYWSAGWWGNWASHLGLLVDPKHPLFAQFPTDDHADWQWRDLMQGATTFRLDDAPRGFRPLVQPVTDFHHNHMLGQVFEARVGNGRLLVCGYDISTNLEKRPAARQFRRSLFAYVAGHSFSPDIALDREWLLRKFTPLGMERLGARIVSCSSFNKGFEPALAIDGRPDTIWHTQWEGRTPGFPHELVIGFRQAARLKGIALLPRQDGNPNGRIRGYEIYAGVDENKRGAPVAAGECPPGTARQEILFAAPVEAAFVRLVIKSGFDAQPFASLAEIEVMTAERNKETGP